MNPSLLLYGILLSSLAAVVIAGYGKIRVGPFFGLTIALGTAASFLSYLLLDLQAALLQIAALGAGSLLFLLAIGVLGDRFSYRSSMLLLASIGLFPLGLFLQLPSNLPIILFGIFLVLNIIFGLLLFQLRKNSISRKAGKTLSKPRFLLTLPAILTVLIVNTMMLFGAMEYYGI